MSYSEGQNLKYTNKEPVEIICDDCGHQFKRLYKGAEKNRKKNGKHLCERCTGYPLKPQHKPEYWTTEKRAEHGISIGNSESYRCAIEGRDTSGEKNPMFGKKASKETREKMSEKRRLRVGSKSPAWKGGVSSVNKRVKGIIHRRHNWYHNVYKRDNWQCTMCGSRHQIDAHHIEPVNKIIKRLCESRTFTNDDEKVAWLANHPDLVDSDLKNGTTLCRECHKKRT